MSYLNYLMIYGGVQLKDCIEKRLHFVPEELPGDSELGPRKLQIYCKHSTLSRRGRRYGLLWI